MYSPSSNMLPAYNFTGGTEICKRELLLTAKFSPGDGFWRGDQNFRYRTLHACCIITHEKLSAMDELWRFLR